MQQTFLISGSTGLVGQALVQRWQTQGHRVVRLVRRTAQGADEVEWDPEAQRLDGQSLPELDGVVHLAGQNVADQRWSAGFKRRIRDSRVLGTRTLVRALSAARTPPRVFVSASGVGYYGDGGDAWLDERSARGTTFLASVCEEWEREAQALEGRSRSVQLRIGMVLSPTGGALAKMLPAFRLGLGGALGSGTQYMSWLALDDLLGIIEHALGHDLRGPVNAVSPNPVTNAEFTRTLARVVKRPAFARAPAFALRAALGEFAEEVLGGQRARPTALEASGYAFAFPQLEAALRAVLSP